MRRLPHPQPEEITLEGVLEALSDPVRLSIVKRLTSETCERPCGHFEAPVHKSTISHHMRVLREAGILRMRPEGTQNLLSLRCEDLDAKFPGLLEAIMKCASATCTRER